MIRYFIGLVVLVCGVVILPLHAEISASSITPSSKASAPKTLPKSVTSTKDAKPSAKPAPAVVKTDAPAVKSAATKPEAPASIASAPATTKRSASTATAKSANTNSKGATASALGQTANKPSLLSKVEGRLARLTAYWAGEGDYYTGRRLSATGVRLHGGHCAVDPKVIPYGSVVEISGLGTFLAVDTGSAVVSRTAAREMGHNAAERGALVIDLFFETRSQGTHFANSGPKFASITWHSPHSADNQTKETRGLVAEENFSKSNGKQQQL